MLRITTPACFAHLARIAVPLLGLAMMSLVNDTPAHAATGRLQSPSVRFDTAALVSCRDITDAAFLADYPDSRLFEAVFRVSSIHQGIDRYSLEHLVQIHSSDRSLQVMGFAPETILAKDVNGVVSVEKTTEGSASIGIDAIGSTGGNAKLNGHASAGGKTIKTERFEQVAPSSLVLASGLMARGSGAYFKVRSTPDTTVEGGQEYTLRFRAPRHWRGGSFQVTCVASRIEGDENVRSTDKRVGSGRFIVATFLAGDTAAAHVASRYVNAEYEMRRAAHEQARQISRQAYPSMIDRLGKVMQVNQPKIPKDWLELLLFRSRGKAQGFERHLPPRRPRHRL